MSEKKQHQAERTRQQMYNRYGDTYHHKHDKRHLNYRMHCRSHFTQSKQEESTLPSINTSTGNVRQLNLQKIRKRLAKNIIH